MSNIRTLAVAQINATGTLAVELIMPTKRRS